MHKKIYRPWGNYTTVVEGIRWQVKLIEDESSMKIMSFKQYQEGKNE